MKGTNTLKLDTRRKFLTDTSGIITGSFISLQGCSSDKIIPDTIYHNGKILTVDSKFSLAEAVAIRGDRFQAVGSNKDVLNLAGRKTQKINLEGRTVVPGLIEAHAHPERASLSESDGPLANPRTIDECLDWIRQQTKSKQDGEWIIHPKLFMTRLRELRAPTLQELDNVSPKNPVFLNASYGGVINSAAMRACGISKDNDHPGLLRDPVTGKLSGKLINTATRLLKLPSKEEPSRSERIDALRKMFSHYNSVGFTSVTSGSYAYDNVDFYYDMRENRMLTIRVLLNIGARFQYSDKPIEEIRRYIKGLGMVTGQGDEWVKIGALKTSIDGGILTGTAYLREPWGKKAGEMFGVTDPKYRGNVRVTSDEFAKLVQAGAESGWKMTAHCTGGGGVDLMLEAYKKVHQTIDVRPLRFSIIHGNFYTPEAMKKAQKLNVIADMQPAWFYKDADAMLAILGEKRAHTFHPYRSLIDSGVIVSAGSDHMVILDSKNSINPYNPWLLMGSMITRKTERGTVIIPEEAITREEALRCYTINNAYASFEEILKGSIEPGKLADMVIIDRDFLTCPVDAIQDIRVKTTVLGGQVVFSE
ncbi:amidohydrolase [Candidatus Omnitrophota bacterium]